MSISSIGEVNAAYSRLQYSNAVSKDTGSDFSSVLSNELSFMQSMSGTKQDYASQYQYLAGMLSGSSKYSSELLAAMIMQGAYGADSLSGMSPLISQTVPGSYSMILESMIASAVPDAFETENGEGIIPTDAWKPTVPAVTSSIYNRSAQLYRNVIDQFDVENHPRYEVNKNGWGDTYCNIFVWDVTTAMGAEIPHYYDPDTGAPVDYDNAEGALQMTANRMYNWLHESGGDYGWFEVSAEEAQNLANSGRPVVTALKNPEGHGHVQVVCPSEDGVYDETRGVTIAQAGRNLYNYRPITKIYNESLPKVVYFAHM